MNFDKNVGFSFLILILLFSIFNFNSKIVYAITCILPMNATFITPNIITTIGSNSIIASNLSASSQNYCGTAYIYLSWSPPYNSATTYYSDTPGTFTANEIAITSTTPPYVPVNSIFNVITSSEISLTFNGISHYITAPSGNTINGNWIVGFRTWSTNTGTFPNPLTNNTLSVNVPTYTSPTITISNNALTLDQGQSITFNGVITGGTSPYTVNVFVANAVTLGTDMLVNTIITSGTTWSNTITTNSLFPSNSPLVANVVLTDSHPTTVTSGYTSNFRVNSALGTPTLGTSTGKPPSIDSGQSLIFVSYWSGGWAAIKELRSCGDDNSMIYIPC